MNYALSLMVGFTISIMVALSGVLTETIGVYHATLVAHITALVVLTLIVFFKKQSLKIKYKVPLFYFSGGLLGVLTTVFNNYAFSYLGVSVMLSLCLFGQSLTSLILDFLHMFNHTTKNNYKTYIGLACILFGIIIMIIY
ncbi:MAG: DMT family transporter [Sphaerochaetaceae bacterium]|nr:DMT family transporter [Sphaerochaetaceae bacterium]MDC7250276.1 DMT family transporter [Sphaerochaetaceae bacterium]